MSIISLQNEIYLGRFPDETQIVAMHMQLTDTQLSVTLFNNCALTKINIGIGHVTRKRG